MLFLNFKITLTKIQLRACFIFAEKNKKKSPVLKMFRRVLRDQWCTIFYPTTTVAYKT